MEANATLFDALKNEGGMVDPLRTDGIVFNNGAFLEQPLGKKQINNRNNVCW
jgi:hypothetical protein